MDWSAAIPTFLVTLREGVEAALVVGIVLACIRQAQQPQLVKAWRSRPRVAGPRSSPSTSV
ncbi:MAG: hypothetical protein EA366_11405, partial [Spirulina sp. DLM2.Bin59]